MPVDSNDPAHRPRALRRAVRLGGAALILTLALTATAAAASKPGATTGGAKDISYASAMLSGVVNPQGPRTRPTTSSTGRRGPTAARRPSPTQARAPKASTSTSRSAACSQSPSTTTGSWRSTASGATLGSDHSFTTTKIPLSLAILASPNPVIFGGPVIVQGTLSGTDNAARQVVLQGNAFPFTAGFVNVGNPELTSATGGFSFALWAPR